MVASNRHGTLCYRPPVFIVPSSGTPQVVRGMLRGRVGMHVHNPGEATQTWARSRHSTHGLKGARTCVTSTPPSCWVVICRGRSFLEDPVEWEKATHLLVARHERRPTARLSAATCRGLAMRLAMQANHDRGRHLASHQGQYWSVGAANVK